MFLGQKINFDKDNKNRLFHFFLENDFKSVSGLNVNQIIEKLATPYQNDDDVHFLKDMRGHELRGIREIITELVRLDLFPNLPSRFECLYASRTIEEALIWKNEFDKFNRNVLQIVKLKTDGPIFVGDANMLPDLENQTLIQKIQQAKKYWESSDKSELPEVLLGGQITVTEIVRQY
ncbi:MAG: DUF2441 domain-containing protein [Streptococcaceae bacterium]|nr:DUF2441 domain-containing protein [Streptococcaceae bacterium]